MGNQERFLVVGDLHLGVLKRFSSKKWQRYTKEPLHQIFQYAREHAIETIIYTGDIFNDPIPSQELLLFFYAVFGEADDLMHIFYPGNHDQEDNEKQSLKLYAELQSSKFLAHCRFYLSPTTLKVGSQKIGILPWPHRKKSVLAGLKLPEKSVVFAHFPIKNGLSDNGFPLKEGYRISSRYYWIIGDLHTPQKGKNYVYPGSPYISTLADQEKRYFLDVELQKGRKPLIEWRRLILPYALHRVTVDAENPDFDFLKRKENKETYWSITYDPSLIVPTHPNVYAATPIRQAAAKSESAIRDTNRTYSINISSNLRRFLRTEGIRSRQSKPYLRLFREIQNAISKDLKIRIPVEGREGKQATQSGPDS